MQLLSGSENTFNAIDLPIADVAATTTAAAPTTTDAAAPTATSTLSSMEISPGVQVRPMHGADETWRAIENDYFMPAECMSICCCESTIFCIQDADYILCPDCRVVSRLEGSSSQGMGGVGLGFKYEDLARARREKKQ